ncbi:ABC transporter substrate-binding protein [Paenibacillus sp. EPM92]|uniref:ABC transporter substrate-binding protein n=1 Tax=Paenibacillus sp. EPM92 TaxID=1561195 RepID=UPI001915318A|nr:ABC transporter substrate-binding protein [Paenibacillus sp. EPM92]
MKTRFSLIVMLLLMTFLSTACGQSAAPASADKSAAPKESAANGAEAKKDTPIASQKPADLKKISISVPAKSLVFLPHYIGVEKGIYKEAGIDLDIQVLKPSAAVAASISGEVPYTGSLGSSLRSVITGGSDLKVVMVTLDNLAFSLFGAKDIKTVQDLKGKAVMVTNSGATDHYSLKMILQNAGLDPIKSVNIVSSSTTANSYQSLVQGAAKGAILSPPYSQMAEQAGYPRLKNSIDVLKRGNAGVSVPGKYLEKNKEEVTKMLQATLESMKYIHEHREETIAFIEKFWELKPELAKGAYEDIVILVSKDGTMEDKVFTEEIQEVTAETGAKFDGKVTDAVDFTIVKSLNK